MLLETSRLQLRPMQPSDWSFFYLLHTQPQVMQFVADLESEEKIMARFNTRSQPWSKEDNSWLTLSIVEKESGQLVGFSGFLSRWSDYKKAEVGFLFAPQFQGVGYGYESLTAVLEYAFLKCGFHKMTATVTEGNTASVALLQKAGFNLEGRLVDNYQIAGCWCNDLLFARFNQ